MRDRTQNRRANDDLVAGQVESDLRGSAGSNRPAVANLPPHGDAAAWVGPCTKLDQVWRELDTRVLAQPSHNLSHPRGDRVGIQAGVGRRGEVQVFREAVRLQIALPEACAALEHPLCPNPGVYTQTSQQPAQHVVSLDDVLTQPPGACSFLDLDGSDHLTARPHSHAGSTARRRARGGLPPGQAGRIQMSPSAATGR